MAEFGANATGTYETPNFIRPQEGAQDRSAEGLLRAAGSGLEQGIELTSAFKGREFRGELDAAVNQEIGMKIASTQEAQPSDTQEFRDAIERAKQVYAQGGPGTRIRTSVLAEKLTREKAGASPLFANVYRQVAREVLSDYDATLQFWTAAEESAARQAQSESNARGELIKRFEKAQKDSGGLVAITKDPFTMTNEELSEGYLVRQRVIGMLTDEQRARQAREEERSIMSLKASIATANAAMTSADIAQQNQNLEKLEVEHMSTIPKLVDGVVGNALYYELLEPMANGRVTPQQMSSPEFRQNLGLRVAAVRSQILQKINSIPATTGRGQATADRARTYLEDRLKEVNELLTGDYSAIKAVSDTLKFGKDQMGLDALQTGGDLLRLRQVYGDTILGYALQNFLMGQSPAAQSLSDQTGAALTTTLNRVTEGTFKNKGDLRSLSEPEAIIGRENSLKIFTNQNPELSKYMGDANFWGIQFVAATDAMDVRGPSLSPRELELFIKGPLTTNFVQNFESLRAADPAQATRVADRYHDTARHAAPAIMRTLQTKIGDPDTTAEGYFARNFPDMRVRTIVDQMNSMLDGLVATRAQDKRAPQKDETLARIYFLEEFFGIKQTQPEEAPQ